MKPLAGILFYLILIFSAAYAADEPLSPSRIALPKIPVPPAKIDIPDMIAVVTNIKPGTIGEESEHWGEKKSAYFGRLELDEAQGLRYTEPLIKDKIKGREHYEHTYYGGTLTEIDFRDKKGNLKTDDKNEAAIIKQRYDKEGNLVEESSYNPDGTLKNDWYGFAIYRWQYDSKHARIKGEFYDETGKLAKKRFCDTAINSWSYYDNGDMAVWANYDTSGKLAKDILGIAATKYEYDESKRETLTVTYGTDRQLANNKHGYAISLQIYDDKKHSKLISHYDKNMKPVENDGIFFVLQTIGTKGEWTESAFYDAEGKLIVNSDGSAIIQNLKPTKSKPACRKIFNSEKKLISEWEFDEKTAKWLKADSKNKN